MGGIPAQRYHGAGLAQGYSSFHQCLRYRQQWMRLDGSWVRWCRGVCLVGCGREGGRDEEEKRCTCGDTRPTGTPSPMTTSTTIPSPMTTSTTRRDVIMKSLLVGGCTWTAWTSAPLSSCAMSGSDQVVTAATINTDTHASTHIRHVHAHTHTLTSTQEGFRFEYPSTWVVAYDRSGRQKIGAVTSVGDFTSPSGNYMVVTVFRLPSKEKEGGLERELEASCIDTVVQSESTIGFDMIQSSMRGQVFDFEYEYTSCGGEALEGSGGVIRCIGRFGQDIPIMKKHVIGRACTSPTSPNHVLAIMASVPSDAWTMASGQDSAQSAPSVLNDVIRSFQPINV